MRLALTLFTLLLLAFPIPASGTAKMFPSSFWSGASGPPLPTRSIHVEAVVRYGLAVVRGEYRFENPSYSPIEGLLRTRVPRNAVITDFAYYFKGVRVPGRILENEEAEEIYRVITSAGRDPALLRRAADGSYEARLFPIEPRSDVRVELEYRYAVPESDGKLKLLLPLTAGRTGRPIDDVQVRATFTGDAFTRVIAAPGSVRLAGGTGVATFAARGHDPRHDLRVTAFLSPATPRRQVLSSRIAPGRAYTALRVRGGSGQPAAALGGRGLFPAPAVAGSSARYWIARGDEEPPRIGWPAVAWATAATDARTLEPFWAQAYTGALVARYRKSRDRRTFDRVVAASKRYRIDTEFTSFLAVPESEWAAYQQRRDDRRRDPVNQVIAQTEQLRYVTQLPRWVAPGDPVIRVKHRPELARVVAVLPDGDVVPLSLDPAAGMWEARFDIPEGAAEGDYPVTVVLLMTDGRRQELTLTYRVDLTAPTGRLRVTTGSAVRLEVTGSADVARVVGLAPDGRRVDLTLDSASGRYRGALDLPPGRHTVRVRLYDRVHNWVEIEEVVDVRG